MQRVYSKFGNTKTKNDSFTAVWRTVDSFIAVTFSSVVTFRVGLCGVIDVSGFL